MTAGRRHSSDLPARLLRSSNIPYAARLPRARVTTGPLGECFADLRRASRPLSELRSERSQNRRYRVDAASETSGRSSKRRSDPQRRRIAASWVSTGDDGTAARHPSARSGVGQGDSIGAA
jgi:hypothetical protein